MIIEYTKHADLKFRDLFNQGFRILKKQVIRTVKNPDQVLPSYRTPRLIAEKSLSKHHKLRVIFEKYEDKILIITFYPTKRSRYEH